MRRVKRCSAVLLLTAMLLTLMPLQAKALEQTELPLDLRNHWSSSYVITMMEHGIISGYPNGRFYPEENLSREEAVSMLYKLLIAELDSIPIVREDALPYTDVSGNWCLEMITVLWRAGVLEDSQSFLPKQAISRGDMAHYTALCLQLLKEKTEAVEETEQIEQAEELANQEESLEATESSEEETSVESADISERAGENLITVGNSTEGIDTDTETTEEVSAEEQSEDEEAAENEEVLSDEEASAPVEQTIETADETETVEEAQENPFLDIEGYAYKDSILYLYENEIIFGYSDGNFRANQTISRAEASTIIYRSSGFELSTTDFSPLPTYNVISVPYISQLYPVYAPVGNFRYDLVRFYFGIFVFAVFYC